MVDGWPFWAVYLLFFCGAMVRAHVTYAAGRGLRAGATRAAHPTAADTWLARLSRHIDRPGVQRAERLMSRYGAPLVTLSFLTVGIQTVLNAAAGALRMDLRRYTPAAVVGSLLWAGVYTTAGFAALDVVRGTLPWWWLLIALGLVTLVVLVTRLVRGRVESQTATTDDTHLGDDDASAP